MLSIFKKLHRTRQKIFKGDLDTLIAVRLDINENFKNNKHLDDPKEIKELIKNAKVIEKELRTKVLRVTEKSDNVYGNSHVCRWSNIANA